MNGAVEISCCLCSEETKVIEVDLGGWSVKYDTIDTERGFCPKHKLVKQWSDDQCPGCVGGWYDCDLWRSFAYRGKVSLTESDLKVIESGICPSRTNRTMIVSKDGIEKVNLSDRASTESGLAFAQAIREYWIKYEMV